MEFGIEVTSVTPVEPVPSTTSETQQQPIEEQQPVTANEIPPPQLEENGIGQYVDILA
ncbi:MAG: hypothetical protein MJB14_09935 [Spirochaetes bacterium]|nr:hypothetical protein [Spirochaetota bacterium]